MTTPSTDTHSSMVACPPLEDIAAFLDGMTLSPEERASITEHLARCESCYEVFAGAAHFLEEERDSSADGTGGRGVLPFPLAQEKNQETTIRVEPPQPVRRASRWLPLAASIVLVAGLGFVGWRLFAAPPKVTIAGMIEPIGKNVNVGESGDLYESAVPRGPGDAAPLPSGPSVMAGVHALDLRLSVQANNVDATASRLYAMGTELKDIFYLPDLSDRYSDEYAKMHTAADLERFRPNLPELERELQESFQDSVPFQFGLWVEAGHVAAKVESPEFFERRANRRFLSHAQKVLPEELGDELWSLVQDDLKAIEHIWDQGVSQDYSTLATHFQKIIERIDEYEEDPLGNV